MKSLLLLPFSVLVLVSSSCRKQPAEVAISETRVLTTHDQEPAVNATSAEQFLPPEILAQIEESGQKITSDQDGPAESAWRYRLPAGDWKVAEDKPMREVNLSFGDGDRQGEIYLSVVGGGLQPNIDRWFRQFGSEPQPLASLGRLDFLGEKGYLIEAAGRYEPGMRRPGVDDQALLGAIVEYEGRVATVKMIGPASEVPSRREQFIKFVASLQRK